MKRITIQEEGVKNKLYLRYDDKEYIFNEFSNNNIDNYNFDKRIELEEYLKNIIHKLQKVKLDNKRTIHFKIYMLKNIEFKKIEEILNFKYCYKIDYYYIGITGGTRNKEIVCNDTLTIKSIKRMIQESSSLTLRKREPNIKKVKLLKYI